MCENKKSQIAVILSIALLLVTLASIPLQYPLQRVQAQQEEQTQTSVPHTYRANFYHQC
jgi:hypothetical protein